jgi:hypothetical protein
LKIKTIYTDVTFWLLIAVNVYLIVYYMEHPDSINDIILLFWIQSVLIGIFNFIDMLTLKNFAGSNLKINGQPVVTEAGKKSGCVAWFFAVHYGIFHLVYLFFLVTLIDIKKIDWQFVQISFFAMLAASVANFVQNKIRNRTEDVNIGAMFFLPYARILPMHLVILVPAFFNISAPMLFLVLKTFADVIMHLVYRSQVFRSPNISVQP